MNSAKEADFVRNGNARGIMGLSRGMSVGLWEGVKDGNYPAFTKIQNHLLHASPTPLRHVPLRLYVPSAASVTEGGSEPGSFRVVQTLVAPRLADQTPQTLGFALRTVLPTLFPSSRDPVLANVVLHGAPVPFSAPLEELMRDAAYPDGWLCLIVDLL
ncbi:autophagy-related protein 5 [Schizothecium vesticola]|uniref:Autophagy protein 5 n=1 Tax=Schizothecium vesticola TaxID=314040 RepID=A0AA40EL51_9PEZI|nr:autophagy-related protein 5 [Schizothecium vesticola]